MRLAIIGASDEAIHTIECAKELGIETVALDGNPEAAGLEVADIPIVVDITDEQATIDVLSKLGTDWVQTVPIGRYLTTTGAVNDALGLPGITKEMAVLCTDKYAFHKALSSEGLRNCRCALVRGGEIEHISDINDIMSYPVILKPRYGSGSRGIMIANDVAELSAILEDMEDVDEDYVIEECLRGEEYGVDAVVIKGKLHIVLIRYKINTPLPNRQAVAYMSVMPTEGIYGQISDYMSDVVNAMELDECLLHADILDTDRGIFAIEVSARPSGHNLHNLFTPLVTGVDMAREYMKYRIGVKYSFDPGYTRLLMIHYFDMEGGVKAVPDRAEAEKVISDYNAKLIDWNCNINPGDTLESVTTGHSLMYRGYYIVELSDWNSPASVAEAVRSSFSIE
ncbi:MAG: ATP-grasp domain-containing protein [Lachnospiraceae bacterium]|nr:ATP-grasp domain-containing protein [Lachnospiraceae bacterium]